MKKAILIPVAALGLFAASMCQKAPVSTYAEGEEEVSVSESQETDEPISLEDENGNKIPDVIEKYYDEHIRDKTILGVTIGSIVSTAVFVLAVVAMVAKISIAVKGMKGESDKAEKGLEETNKALMTLGLSTAEYCKKLEAKMEEYKAQAESLMEKFEEASETLKDYEKAKNLLIAIANAVEELAKNPDSVSSGIHMRIAKIIEEAKADASEE